MKDAIIVKGTRVHNLQDIDVEIPRNELVVITCAYVVLALFVMIHEREQKTRVI